MNVIFVARAINRIAGGVERTVTTVMNTLVSKGCSVSLLTWDQLGALSFYPMSPDILWYKLDMGDPSVKAGTAMRVRRAMAVRRFIHQAEPNVIVCFQDGPFMAIRIFTLGMNIPVIAAERNAPTRFEHTKAIRRRTFTYFAFRFAERLLIQCESYRAFYPGFLQKRIVTIPNPVFPTHTRAQPAKSNSNGRFHLLSVGRLSYQKNYSILIEAFAAIASDFPHWELIIIGEGEDRSKLEKIIHDRSLTNRIHLPGVTNSISDHYTSSHLFCLSSRWEGFPNAMAEAMSHGLPVVGFSECSGVNKLIKHSINGLLAESNGCPESLSVALRTLMSYPEMRQSMSEAAVNSIKEYAPDKIFSLWLKTLAEAAAK